MVALFLLSSNRRVLNLQLRKMFLHCIAMETEQNFKYDCVLLEAMD